MIRILFVDDDEFVLMGLKRLIRFVKDDWEVEFASSGPEALKMCATKPFDVVVSDMRMPEMDGITLLSEIQSRYPDAIRIILSGQYDAEVIYRAFGPAHRYLSKPCTLDKLEPVILGTCAIRDRLKNNPGIQRIVSTVSQLPSLPSATFEIVTLLHDEQASLEQIGDLISADAAMTAKVLQLANSAFFQSPTPISNVSQAITFLGLGLLKPLVLSAGVFAQPSGQDLHGISLQRIMSYGVTTGLIAREIAVNESSDDHQADAAMVAGVLQDVGVLMLAQHFAPELNEATALCQSDETLSLADAELQVFGANHGEIGAYLLSLWGLPHSIVEAVAHHQKPHHSMATEFCPLAAVHAANCLQTDSHPLPGAKQLDTEFLQQTNLSDRMERWSLIHANMTNSTDRQVGD